MFFFKERVDFTFRTHVTREAPSPNTILTTDFALMEAAGAVSRISDEPREKNTCALEKKRKARRPRRVRLGLRPGPRHCHRLPLRRGWEQFLDLIPNSGEKQVIMATIRGLWFFFFLQRKHVWTAIDYSIFSDHRNRSLLWKKTCRENLIFSAYFFILFLFLFFARVFYFGPDRRILENKTHKLISH